MVKLAEILKEDCGKDSYGMKTFFQKMIDEKKLEVYQVKVNKEIVEKDNDEEKIVKVKKGATLTPTKSLSDGDSCILKDSQTNSIYHLSLNCRGGMFFDDGDFQTMYHHCLLEKLNQKFDTKKVTPFMSYSDFGSFPSGISIPDDMVIARLRMNYDVDEYNGNPEKVRANLVIEGEKDDLFTKVYEFIKDYQSSPTGLASFSHHTNI